MLRNDAGLIRRRQSVGLPGGGAEQQRLEQDSHMCVFQNRKSWPASNLGSARGGAMRVQSDKAKEKEKEKKKTKKKESDDDEPWQAKLAGQVAGKLNERGGEARGGGDQ